MTIPEALNLEYLEEQYQQYQSDPTSVGEQWRLFFQGFDLGLHRSADPAERKTDPLEGKAAELIHRFRDIGHLLACMDPLTACPTSHPLLELSQFGLDTVAPDTMVATPQFSFAGHMSLKQLQQHLKQTYCRSIGVEYMHIQDPDERKWLQQRMEPEANRPALTPQTRHRILEKLIQAAAFEQFLNKKYLAVTRFSLEGGDGLIPMLDALLPSLHHLGGREVILGMAHRGRLNVQANILNRPVVDILAEFEHCHDATQLIGAGDVKYHNGYLGDVDLGAMGHMPILLANNPSHLEAVSPVIEGITRARQELTGDGDRHKVMAVLIHGDAAFAGQGIVAETLNMSHLEGYTTGGTIHIIINNQIGYTTLPQDARSTRYATDAAKMLMVPIFHVHGENPEALVHVIRLAAEYRYAFAKDVVVDVVCYRRHGHNEGDEPYFTQPLMYERIHDRPVPEKIYADQLIAEGVIDQQQVDRIMADYSQSLEAAYQEVHGSTCAFPEVRYYPQWEAYHGRFEPDAVDTTLAPDHLKTLARRINTLPDGFNPHPKLADLFKRRLAAVEQGEGIDWANAEALAMASLVTESFGIRLSGQDSGRGTFSQRHAIIYDTKTGTPYIPITALASMAEGAADRFHVFNSLLAEAGVLGFEYGFSVTDPDTLTLWEAQFGDFANNAQSQIDLFLAAGEAKWQRLSGLTLLLPHGWEGLGPEHSSARLERYLQLCAVDNMQVCDLSTPAQYFHLLRRQVKAPFRKPLVIMTPKSLLRHPRAVSSLNDLSENGFHPVLDDPSRPLKAKKMLLCSGKIFYQLLQRKEELKKDDIAIVRIEQLYPFPETQLQKIIDQYEGVKEYVWVQEAPQNMGAWHHVRPYAEGIFHGPLAYVGRTAAASPATGFPEKYKEEQETIVTKAVGPPLK